MNTFDSEPQQCPNVLMQCQKTILDNPVKLVTLVVCSLGAVYLMDLGIQWTVENNHYKSRGVRRAILQIIVTNALLLAVYYLGIDPNMNVNLVSILLLSAMVMGIFSVVNITKTMPPLHGGLFVAFQTTCFYLFYKYTSP